MADIQNTEINTYLQGSQYKVGPIPYHTHNGTDSPYVQNIQQSSLPFTLPLSVANGGTGDATLTAHGVLLGEGTSAVHVTSAGTSGQVLTSNGAGADPTFQNAVNPFGNGSDGALSIVSSTTTLDFANANILVKNYTSVSISGGTLQFQNPASTGSLAILLVQGNVSIINNGVIDISSMGASGGTGGASAGAGGTSGTSVDSLFLLAADAPNGIGAATGNGTNGGAGGAVYTLQKFYLYSTNVAFRHLNAITPGSGGGGGAAGQINGAGATAGSGGNGGRGGGSILIICGGAFNFTAGAQIKTSAAAGGNGTAGHQGTGLTGTGGGGGGGGSGGWAVVLYNSLTANAGTVSISGGNGGNGGTTDSNTNAANTNAGGGGGGGGMYNGAGGNGGPSTNPGTAGGNGSNSSTTGAGRGTGGAGGTITGSQPGFSYAGGGGGGGTAGEVIITQYIP